MTNQKTSANEFLYPQVSGGSAAAIISGQAHSGKPYELSDPSTGQTVGTACWGTSDNVDEAVRAGLSAWAEWKAKSARARAGALRDIASTLRTQLEPLAELIVEETGKRVAEARAEVSFSAQYFEWFAEAAVMQSEAYLTTEQRRFVVRHEPVGVVAAVTPWNFPLSIPARKLAAALAAGCPVVLKPSELTPRSGLALVALMQKHVPTGLVNAVVGDGKLITTALVNHSGVRSVTFTGSTAVGILVAEQAVTSMTRMVLELGGMAPFIVTKDCDVALAVDALMVAKFRNNGASCIAANNVFVHIDRYAEVLAELKRRVRELVVGDPRNDDVDLGPMIRPEHVDRLRLLVADAERSGAQVTKGNCSENGWFVEPTIVELDDNDAQIWHEEVFGPICVVKPYSSEDAVVDEVNAWQMGLAGFIISRDAEGATNLAQRLRVGIVGINNGAPNTPEVPFGGFGLAGVGREGGLAGMMEFMESQSISVAR